METMKAICTATILALALCLPVQGGEINTPGMKSAESGIPEITACEGLKPSDDPSTDPGDMGSPGFTDVFMMLLSVLL